MQTTDPKHVNEMFEKHFNANDVEAMLSLYEDDAVSVPAPGQTAQGKDAIRGVLEGFLSMGGSFELIKQAEPIVNGRLALMHARWRMTVEGQEPLVMDTDEVVRLDDDGQWRYVIGNPWGAGVLDA